MKDSVLLFLSKSRFTKIKIVLTSFIVFLGIADALAQTAGFNSSYGVFNQNGTTMYMCMPASGISCGANATLEGYNFGNISGTGTLILEGAQHNVWKCGTEDITATNLYYSIFPNGGTPNFTDFQ